MNQLIKNRGFTMVELVTVMVIIGILAAVVMPRFFDNSVFQNRGAADQVKAALRYGQKVAIAQHRIVIVSMAVAASSDCGTVLVAGNVSCTISNSVTPAPSFHNVSFDALGRPVPNGPDSVSVGGTTITIEQETGYVH